MPGERLTSHETKALRLLVLYQLREAGQLDLIPDALLARQLGAARTTIYRDRQLLDQADAVVARLLATAPWGQPAGLTVTEAAARLGCKVAAVRYRLQIGQIPAEKDATGHWRIPESAITHLEQRGGLPDAF